MTTTKNILKWVVYIGLLIIPFIPFIVPSAMFFPFISGKGFVFRIVVELMFGAYILWALIDSSVRPKMTWITKSVLLFTFVMLVADLFGANAYKSLWSNYERMEGFVLLAHLLLYYVIVSSVLNTKDIWNKFLNTNIFSSVLISFYGLFQIFGWITINQGGNRVDATFGNSAYLAIYLVFNIFLCMYMVLQYSLPKWQRYSYGAVVLLELVILYYTATRGAILGLIGGLVVAAILVLWKERENRIVKKSFSYLLGFLVLFVFCFFIFKDSPTIKNNFVLSRFSSLSFSEFKTQGRYFVWPMALKGIADKPVLGWGQENFNFVFNKYYDPQMFGQEEWFDRTHNVFLDWLIAGGIVGFLSYASIYFALFYYIWRKKSTLKTPQKSVLTGMIVAYIFHNIFVFDNLISYIMFFTVLAFVHSLNDDDHHKSGDFYTKTFSNDTLKYIAMPVVLILTIITVYYINVPAILANQTLIKAISPQQEKGVDENLRLFKKVYSYNSFGNSEATEQLVTITSQIYAAQRGPTDVQKQAFVDLTKSKLDEKLEKTPNDTRYLMFAGSFYNRLSQYDKAIEYLEKALILSPKKQTIHFELGTSYLGKGNFQKTFDLFKTAYESKPSSNESTILYSLAAIYTKNDTVLKELSVKLDPKTIVSDNRFLTTYINTGDYNSAINILNIRLSNDPKNKDNKLYLAWIYGTIGQRQKAVAILEEVIADDPSFKDEGELYIKQLLGQ